MIFFANLGQELASKIPIRAEYDPIKDYMPPSNSLSMYCRRDNLIDEDNEEK